MRHQQKLKVDDLAIVVLSSNAAKMIEAHVAEITAAIDAAKLGTFIDVELADISGA